MVLRMMTNLIWFDISRLRWYHADKHLTDLSLWISLYLSLCISLCISLSLSNLSLSRSLSLYICLSFFLSLCISIYLFLSLSLSLSLYLSLSLSISLYIYLSFSLSLCISLSVFLSLSNLILIYPILIITFYETFTIRSWEADYFLIQQVANHFSSIIFSITSLYLDVGMLKDREVIIQGNLAAEIEVYWAGTYDIPKHLIHSQILKGVKLKKK